MFKKLLFLLLLGFLITSCDHQERPVFKPIEVHTDAAQILGIDEKIVYFDIVVHSPCAPYLLEDYNAYFCSLDNVIYYGNGLNTIADVPTQYWLLAHEDGHSADPDFDNAYVPAIDKEQFADCYGGQKIRELRDKDYFTDANIQSIIDFIYTLPQYDIDHGTPDQRYKAFVLGYDNGDCSVY